jgi:translation initiation factor 4G
VKGILNKLTPEKFERLLDQLLSVITTADILKHTITLVFENAVAQPTFCAMYADLCLSLSKELPSFPPAEGEDKPVMFRRVLLNTCQDEFEAAESAREVSRETSVMDAYRLQEGWGATALAFASMYSSIRMHSRTAT